MKMKLLAMFAALSACCLGAAAAEEGDSLGRKASHYLEVELNPALLLPTNPFFRGENLSGRPLSTHLSAHLKYGFSFSPDSRLGRLNPYAVQGIGAGWNSFLNPEELGNPVSVYIFQTSRIASLTEKLSLDYEWNFGVSFGWKKYDETYNPRNVVVGSSANAYIKLGLLLNWRLAPGWNLCAGADFTHFSNGNTSLPNAGVNSLGISLGTSRSFGSTPAPAERRPAVDDEGRRRRVSYDLTLFGAWKKKYFKFESGEAYIVPGNFAVFGLNFNPLYSFNSWFKAGLSLDARFDESANIWEHVANDDPGPYDDIRFHRPPFMEQFSLGLSARIEVAMPIFSINLGIGRNFLGSGPDIDGFYQDFVLKTMLGRRFYLSVGYQLYQFRKPDHLMLGAGIRI